MPNDYNDRIIAEFRASAGQVGGPWRGRPLLLLHHLGARSGSPYVNPLAYQRIGRDVAVFASKGGAPSNPDWYYNLLAHPDTTIEIGAETCRVRARVATGEERERIWSRQKADSPAFAEYETKAGRREIPVVVLEQSTG